jgi:Ca2+/Na+ antiporter
LLCLGICIYLLASTADEYLSPALEAISDKFRCSESIAGVTLLALGNGAPDVFAALSAGGTSQQEVNLQVSSLFGSVFYISAVVVAATLRSSTTGDTIQVTREFFIRDAIFLLITSAYTLVILLVFKGFSLLIASGYLIIYVIFVIVVGIQASMHKSEVREAEDGEMSDDARAESVLRTAEVSVRAKDFQKLADHKKSALGRGKGSVFRQAKFDARLLNDDDDLSAGYRRKDKGSVSRGLLAAKLRKRRGSYAQRTGSAFAYGESEAEFGKGGSGSDLSASMLSANMPTRTKGSITDP